MTPDLTESDRERFAELREKLEGVTESDEPGDTAFTDFKPLDPMLADTFDGELAAVDESDWYAERKFDGTRILLEKFNGDIRLYTRRHIERSDILPDVVEAARDLPDGVVLDGEVTFIDPEGRSYFTPIHGASDAIAEYDLRTVYYVFDMLVQDSTWMVRGPLVKRRERLQDVVPDTEAMTCVEERTTGFQAFFDEMVEKGEEGIMLKRRNSPYHLNTRSEHWQKVKAFTERDVLAVGYTPGEGQRASTFGALVMMDGEEYIGRVGTGFSERELDALLDLFEEIDNRPVSPKTVGMPYTPINPVVIKVKYQAITENNELRAPVYLRVKPDAPLDAVEPIDQ